MQEGFSTKGRPRVNYVHQAPVHRYLAAFLPLALRNANLLFYGERKGPIIFLVKTTGPVFTVCRLRPRKMSCVSLFSQISM